jgi:hypothetical protein
MRMVLACLVSVGVLAGADTQAAAEDKPVSRYGIEADLKTFPQATPHEAFGSILKAIETKRIDYLIAHLADPDWVEKRVRLYGSFPDVVKEASAKLDNPATIKLFQRFYKEGAWDDLDTTGWSRLKNTPERILMRKIGTRWFLENKKT